jgi:hypothetical protein
VTGKLADDDTLQFLSPLSCEHINLIVDCVQRQSRKVDEDKNRPLCAFKDGPQGLALFFPVFALCPLENIFH